MALRTIRAFRVLMFVIVLVPALCAQAQGATAQFRSVEWRHTDAGMAVDIRIDGPVQDYKTFVLDSPARIVIDVPGLTASFAGEQRVEVGRPPVQRIRYSVSAEKGRFVIETDKAALHYHKVAPAEHGFLILIGNPAGKGVSTEARNGNPAAEAPQATPKSAPESAPAGSKAGDAPVLQKVSWTRAEESILVDVAAGGAIKDYRTMKLEDPCRIVVDLPGLASRFSGEQRIEVNSAGVHRIRHLGYPDKVRLVLETDKQARVNHTINPTAGGIEIAVAAGGAQTAARKDSRAEKEPQAAAAETPSGGVPASGTGSRATVQDIEVAVVDGQVVIQVKADGGVADYKAFTTDNPSRIVFDIPNLNSRYAGERRIPIKDGNGRQVRYFNQADSLRVLIDTDKKNLGNYSAYRTEAGMVIAVGTPAPSTQAAAAPAPVKAEAPGPEIERPTWGGAAAAAAVQRALAPPEPEDPSSFEIKRFEVNGNTLLSPQLIEKTLKPFAGRSKKAEDVENARDALEKQFHDKGYPTVLVNIPEQSVETGVVRLEVIQSRIGRVRVSGNEYFTIAKILKELPSLREGEILYLPKVQEDLAGINRNPDIKVAPILGPGEEPGTIDVELKVKDKLPLHASWELNNRNTHDTTDLRMNTQVRYDNLWQRDHSVSLQFQTSPQDIEQVFAVAGSYVLPAPWGRDNVLAVYGLYTDSNTAFGSGFSTVGKGWVAGFRNVIPLPAVGDYAHNLSLGMDYKDFEDNLSVEETEGSATKLQYLPLSFAYNSSMKDTFGVTQFSSGINMAIRGLVTRQEEFQEKRYNSRGNYIYLTGGLERTQSLPYGLGLFGKVDGQISDQPLISNEQFIAGGLKSVRGYKETEATGDDGLHFTVEFLLPDVVGYTPWKERGGLTPYIFYDFAWVKLKEPLPGEDKNTDLQGAGVGLRGAFTEHLDFELAWGMALAKTEKTDKGDSDVYFVIKGQF
jgi:hemolysin activation/secretion protein